MKKETLNEHNRIANDALFYIYTHIDTDVRIEELAASLGVSRYHLQRIFKAAFGTGIYATLKSIRLEKAANLLLVNAHSPIYEIARLCGYGSQASFIKAFCGRFGMTPGQWRRGGFAHYSKKVMGNIRLGTALKKKFEKLDFVIERRPEIRAYYIRHKGYDASIAKTWQRLRLFRLSHDLDSAQSIALYHDNPAIRPLPECAYVACLATDRVVGDSRLPVFKIAGGVYARFDLQGEAGEEIALMHWIYHHWLPKQGFETTPKPSYAVYRKNHFLGEKLDLSYYVSVTF